MSRLARIDLGAISRNVETLRAASGGITSMAVVKADGYGHGAVPSARAALEGGTDWLGVATIEEALELREAGIEAPILAWLHETDATFPLAVQRGIDLGVSTLHQLEAIAALAPAIGIHLKVDTGLGRSGATPEQWPALVAAAAAHERAGRVRVRGVWSHLSNAGEEADLEQVARFAAALDVVAASGVEPELVHLAATAASLRLPEARFTMVRLGIGCYGLSPFADATSHDLGLTPAMTLSTTVAATKRVPPGQGVSYGFRYRTAGETTLALVPLGYADGVPRSASGRGPVAIRDATYRVAGTIAMDQFVIDVGNDPVVTGDRVTLFGDPATGVPSADDWAIAAGTINYEIVTRIGQRVRREYV
jgi:alanine racemase